MPLSDIESKRFQQSSHTALLIAALSRIAQAEDYRVIGYSELNAIANVTDIQTKQRHYFYSANERIQRDLSRRFVVIAGVGVKLGTHEETSKILNATNQHIQRSSKRGRYRASVTQLDKLTNECKLQHMTQDSIAALHEGVGRVAVARRLQAHYASNGPKSIEAEDLIKIGGVKLPDKEP